MATIHRIGARGVYQDTEQGSSPVAAHGVQQEQVVGDPTLFIATARTRARYRKAPQWPFTVDIANPISRGLIHAFVSIDGWRWVDVAPATSRRKSGYDPFAPATVDASSNIGAGRIAGFERAPGTDFYAAGSGSRARIDLGTITGTAPLSGYNTQEMSWSIWFYLAGTGVEYPFFMDKSTAATAVNGWSLFLGYLTGTDRKPELRVAAVDETMGSNQAFSTGAVHHLGLSYAQADNNRSHFVQDGTVPSYARLNTSFVNASAGACIGNRSPSGDDRPFDGQIAHILVWDRSIEVREHQELYALRHGIFDSVRSERSFFLSPAAVSGQPMMRRWGGSTHMPAGTGRRSW